MTEYKFQLVIAPESYDYGEEEIVYRIYYEDQLISERSLPALEPNQVLTDNFVLILDNNMERKKNIILQKNTVYNSLFFVNIKNKKSFIKKITINDKTELLEKYKNIEGFLMAFTVDLIDIGIFFYNGFPNK